MLSVIGNQAEKWILICMAIVRELGQRMIAATDSMMKIMLFFENHFVFCALDTAANNTHYKTM